MFRALRSSLLLLFLAGLVAPLSAQPPSRPAESKPIIFYIYVPADAQIDIEGVKTTKTGEARDFKTPDVTVGRRYTYTVKVTYQGKTTTHQMALTHAGPNILDLRKELTAGKPATTTPTGPTFTLLAPANLSLRPGDAAPVTIKIKRQGLNDAVELSFQGLPAGVKINDATIAAGKDEQSALAMTDATARPGTSVIDVIAKSGKVQKQATFRLTIAGAGAAPGEPAKKDAKPGSPPADLPAGEPPRPPRPGETKKDAKPKTPPADLPNDPPPKPPGDTKKPGPEETK
jgi:uncharacterized protein (TIGR03000 family)